MKFLLVVVAILAVSAAKEGDKDKRDILIASRALPYASYYAPAPAVAYTAPAVAYAAPAVAYPGYDDGQYFPGKYERPTFYSAPHARVIPYY